MADWRAHPAFAPYRGRLAGSGDEPPALEVLASWARDAALALPDGRPLSIVAEQSAVRGALAFERRVHDEAILAVRPGSWHDAMNVLVWIAFPRLKAALNARHCAHAEARTANRRDRVRDAATLVDESGLIFACDEPDLVRLLRTHAWRELFVGQRDRVRRVAVRAIGHGLLDRLRAPYRAITAKALVLPHAATDSALDTAAAAAVSDGGFEVAALSPLPVAALPGWDREGLREALFDDVSVFRPKVL